MIAPGGMLPATAVVDAGSGEVMDLRRGRGPRIVLSLHQGYCERCRRYARSLGAIAGLVREWGGCILILVPAEAAQSFRATLPDQVRVLTDETASMAGDAAVVVADAWGEVYAAANAGAAHGLPPATDLAEWLKFIAIQCPECGAPEGGWRSP